MSLPLHRSLIFSLFLGAPNALLAGTPIPLPADVLDTADVNFTSYSSNLGGGFGGIADAASLGVGGGADHFDGAFGVGVNGSPYGPSAAEFDGSTLALSTESIGQFDVSVSLRSTGPILRQIVTVTNTGPAATASVSWHNNTGNDSGQQTTATSTGDLIADLTDRWVVTADSTVGTANEVNSWILYGPGNPSVTTDTIALVDGLSAFGGAGEQGLSASFDVPLAAGESASLLWFAGIEGINADGIALAEEFDNTSSAFFAGLISDLTAAEQQAVVNWTLTAVPEPTSLALLALGAAALRTRRRHG